MIDYGPWARIVLRYGIGFFAGSEAGEALALDPDLQMAVAAAMAAAVEGIYAFAKKRGWAT
jgi:preprotein translocase subunit Sec61beta